MQVSTPQDMYKVVNILAMATATPGEVSISSQTSALNTLSDMSSLLQGNTRGVSTVFVQSSAKAILSSVGNIMAVSSLSARYSSFIMTIGC